MSLPERYGKRIRQLVGAVAVWLPGSPVPLGTLMVRENGRFKPVGKLGDFTGIMAFAPHQEASLNVASQGTRQRLFQAGVELPSAARLDLTAEASLRYEFSRKFDYVLKTPTLRGAHITNIAQIAAAVKGAAGWDHKAFFLVHETYEAEQFSFIGNEEQSSSLELSGKGAAILGFLSAGASADLSRSGSAHVELLGEGGTLAMGLVRIRRDATLDFVP